MDERLNRWEVLFQRTLALIDSAREIGIPVHDWTFGGGTVLMRRHRHRFSKDIDIFINDPQFLGYLTPRLSPTAESLTTKYIEEHNYVKLVFPEGEIDFVAAPPLTTKPAHAETLFEHRVLVETSAEILAKKVWHRGFEFTARDIFDLSMVAEREPQALNEISSILRDRRTVILERIVRYDSILRETFAELAVMEYMRSFDECVATVTDVLMQV
jgi:predicted nucleotidyltransferase component of viral defense system